ncbi:MAG TPA: YceI family protein [Cyclobacteriaceae bacterium]|nr:YceI family protein [Cyclobacteriaceae bacterium]HNP07585.1 YceI family protein [Cyclobacteriaceae bacterium]HRK53455.1 YceI family protein [Cyclobacteriaceae bacterium]
MRVIVICILLGLMGFTTTPEGGVLVHRFIVLPSSKITIDGKTNVNSFRCAITQYVGRDTLVLQEGGRNKKPFFKKGYVGLEAARFDCGVQLMTNDFWKTIKYKEYPVVSIEFISFERTLQLTSGNDIFKGRMQISLAGVTRPFEMNCTIEVEESGLIHFKGGRQFTFSDFNLEAPSKMMGLVKVENEIEVSFHLVLLLDKNA